MLHDDVDVRNVCDNDRDDVHHNKRDVHDNIHNHYVHDHVHNHVDNYGNGARDGGADHVGPR